MRNARSNDVWRKLYKRDDRKIKELEISYEEITELGSGTLNFNSPINLICGENGAGKSAAIWTIARALEVDQQLEGSHKISRPKATSGRITSAIIKIKSNSPNVEAISPSSAFEKLGMPDEPSGALIIDSGLQIPHLLSTLRSDANPQDLINGIKSIELRVDELAQIQQLTGKNYSRVEIFEVEDYANFSTFPFIKVEYASIDYDCLAMGLGEYTLLYLFWMLRKLPANHIVLIEEPESFIAPRSQRVFIDFLAVLANSKGHFVIISSHSGTIADRIPNDAIYYCARNGGDVIFQKNPQPHLLIERIGLHSRRRFLALVEDESAKFFCRSLIDHQDSRLSADVDILVCNSNSKIINALESIDPNGDERIRIIGIFDGDQRVQESKPIDWPIVFLPKDRNPDFEMHALITPRSTGEIASILRIEKNKLVIALSGVEGQDHHDWTNGLCEGLGLQAWQFFDRITPLWIKENPADAQTFYSDFRNSWNLK